MLSSTKGSCLRLQASTQVRNLWGNLMFYPSAFSDLAANLLAVVVHMGSRLEQVSSYLLKNLYWRSSFSVPSTPTRVSLGTREERSLLDSGGSSRSSETGSWPVSKGKVRVLMSYLRPLYKQLSENFKEKDEFRSWKYWCFVKGWTGSRTWNSNMSRRRSRKNFSSHMSGP